MPCVVPYGLDEYVDLELSDETLVAICDEPLGESLDDPGAATAAALAKPLNFPPLARAMVPGDHIVLALDHGVPEASALVATIANYLIENGAAADHLTLLKTSDAADGEWDPRDLLPPAWRNEVTLEVHSPDTQGSLSLLASSHDGKPVYLNRTLLDADLVVPIGCLRSEMALGYFGRYGGLFPTFADAETQQRFRKPAAPGMIDKAAHAHRKESAEVGWLMGTQFTVQALPGGSGRLLGVLAGEISEVFQAGRAAYDAAWRCGVPHRASLVIASLSGGPQQQTWDNLAQALATSLQVVTEDGAIALCTQLTAEPGPAVASLSQVDDLELARKRIRRESATDALAASQLISAMERGRIYLLSQLDESLVDDLGLAPMTEPTDVARLAHRHESCIVLANAQYVMPVIERDD
jgi:nickel-dependent lactate racemase